MPTNLQRLAVVCCTLCICATALQQHSSYRLVVGDGGYARLLKPAPSLSDLTLAAWVNITEFPYGVAPILTAVSPEADSQVAFFLRHDGLGVLWGGPGPLSVQQYQLDQVDRHPRTQWVPVEQTLQKRQRRDAVDYSVGLGDIENIMADSRKGRSFNTWTPYSFVDVDTMGVADLEASPSGLNEDLHLLPTRDGFSRSESYNDWTVVPYELTMQESDPYDLHLKEPEPRIITEPSGDDDFVLFNWNVPQQPKPSIPQSPNEWSPMWHPNKDSKDATGQEEIKHISAEKIPWENNAGWSSQVTEVKLGPNHWNPYGIRGTSFTNQSPKPKPSTTTTLRPITTTNRKITIWPARTTTPRPVTKRPITPHSTLRWRTSKLPTTTTTTVSPHKILHDRHQFASSSQNIPRVTTIRRPGTREPSKPRQTPSLSRQSTRMPLWKLINQPNSHQSSSHHDNITTTVTTTLTTPTQTTPTQRTPTTSTSKSKTTMTTETTTIMTTTQKPTTRTLGTRKHQLHSLLSSATTSRPRTPSTSHFTPSQSESTEKPQITGLKSKVSIWSTAEDPFKHKEPSHTDKWSNKSYGNVNTVNKQKTVQIRPHHVEEFKRAMEGVPAIKDGNTAIVYSVPITNVDAFNAMYEHYQSQSAPEPPQTTKAPIIHKGETFVVHEEETNENQLGENNLHLSDSIKYGFSNEPEETYKETVAPVILTEEKAVLMPTEDPLPSTPSRSDIPIELDDKSYLNQPNDDTPIIQYADPIKKFEEVFEHSDTRHSSSVIRFREANSPYSDRQPSVVVPNEDKENLHNQENSTEISTKMIPSSTPVPELTTETSTKTVITSTLPDVDVSESITTKTYHRNSGYRPTIPPIINFSTKTVQTDKPIIVNEFSPSLPQLSTKTTAEPSTITSTQKTFHIKTNAHSSPPKNESTNQDNSSLESNNFAVFHISEDDIPYQSEEKVPSTEEVFSVDDIYQNEGILVTQEETLPVAHYQEPSHLYHQQLPPEYKYEAAPRPIAYGGPINQVVVPKTDESQDIIYSADPQTLIEQGLLPQPVHYVSSRDEADKWMQNQSKQDTQEDQVFTVESSDIENITTEVPLLDQESPSPSNNNFNFRKLPFDFLENQWYHIVFTWSSKDHQIGVYINGELVGTLTNVLSGQNVLEGGGLTILGQTLLPDLTDFDPTSQFIGELSDMNLWGQRFGPEAVRALYQCKMDVSASPVLNWQQLSMRFYSDVTTHENNILCGA